MLKSMLRGVIAGVFCATGGPIARSAVVASTPETGGRIDRSASRLCPARTKMLQINKPRPLTEPALRRPNSSPRPNFTRRSLASCGRRFSVIAFTSCSSWRLPPSTSLPTPPKFTGHAVLMIDTHKTQFFQQQHRPSAICRSILPTVDTQIEILNSENIALSVVKQLHLDQDPEFIYPRAGISRGRTRLLLESRAVGRITGRGGRSDFRGIPALADRLGHRSKAIWR